MAVSPKSDASGVGFAPVTCVGVSGLRRWALTLVSKPSVKMTGIMPPGRSTCGVCGVCCAVYQQARQTVLPRLAGRRDKGKGGSRRP